MESINLYQTHDTVPPSLFMPTYTTTITPFLGDRFNSSKPKWSLVDYDSLLPLVEVLEYGAKKYSPDNWKKGLSYTETVESLLRHTYAFLNGEDKDKESGIEHVGHILCNAMFLSYMIKNRSDLDDRYSKSNSSEVEGD